VRGKVSTPTTPKSPRVKRTFSISGTVQPVPTRRARVEWYRVSGATKKLYSAQTVTLSSAGKWTIKRTLPKGSWAVRVVYTDSLKVVTNGGFRSFRVK
jgi:hypothetical protein